MSPEKQRIAIAEACGWESCGWRPVHSTNKATDLLLGGTEDWWRNGGENTVARFAELPDYLNDLNAIHEAEKVLAGQQVHAYVTTLCLEVQPSPSLWNATATQRAEAFLRTLTKWEDA